MKRVLMFSLVTALLLAFIVPTAFARSQNFTNFSVLYVPSGYTPEETNGVVKFTKDGQGNENIWESVAVEAKAGRTLNEIVTAYFNELNGTDKNEVQGRVSFHYKDTGDIDTVMNIFDSNFNTNLKGTDVCIMRTTATFDDSAFREILYSLVFDSSKTQKFTKLDVANIPTDWTASDSNGLVTLSKKDDKDCFISIEVASKANRRIQDIATTLREAVNGDNINNTQGAVRFDYVQTGNLKVREVVFDNNFNINLPDGYYCVMKYTHEKATLADFYFALYSTTFHPEGTSTQEGDNTGDNTDSISNSVQSITSTETRNNIAKALGTDVSNVNFINNTSLRAATAPTAAVIENIKGEGYTIASNLSSINVEKAGQQAFQITVPTALQGKEIANVKLYLTNKASVGTGSVETSELMNGVTEATLRGTDGAELATLPASAIATANLNSLGEYGVHIAQKTGSDGGSLGGSGGGGCVAGMSTFASLGALLTLAFFKKR